VSKWLLVVAAAEERRVLPIIIIGRVMPCRCRPGIAVWTLWIFGNSVGADVADSDAGTHCGIVEWLSLLKVSPEVFGVYVPKIRSRLWRRC